MSDTMERLVSLCKRKEFVFQSSEIYGGLASCWDYGPLGAELKRNVKEAWWRDTVTTRPDVVGLDCSILMHPRVWEASGHLDNFTDPMVDCKLCKGRFRADQLEHASCPKKPSKRPGECEGELTEPRNFNLMFKTHMGPVESEDHVVYLRPETAQGIFTNFENVRRTARMKVPFGIAQIGKSFRNEITPGQFVVRTREFDQMEMEYFCRPEDADAVFSEWVDSRHSWYIDLGMTPENLRMRQHEPEELAHYAAAAVDVEYMFSWGWDELEGIANRTDFDLKAHMEHSGEDLTYFDQESDERFVPYVVETAAGATRTTFAFLIDAYTEEEVNGESRVVLKLDSRLAPIKVAVLPLSKKPDLVATTQKVADMLRDKWQIEFDVTQSIGRRYRRQDEIGTPFCVTVDFDSLEDNQVTVRDRDTMDQDRIPIDGLTDYLSDRLPN